MNLSARDGVVRVDLSAEERVILHLSHELPMPETPWDLRARPRTVEGIVAAVEVPRPTVHKIMQGLHKAGAAQVRGHLYMGYEKGQRTSRASDVWQLTADGRALAEAIRERCL